MNAFAKYVVVLCALAAALPIRAAEQVRVAAQVDTSGDIYVGEPFTYNIIIEGEDKPGRVDLGPLTRYNPQSLGNRDLSQTTIRTINKKTTTTIIKRFVMSYALTCEQPGRIRLPSVKVTIDEQTFQTNPISLNILKPGTTDRLDLQLALSEQECYVGQPVTITGKFYVSANIGEFQLNVPVFNSDAFTFDDPDIIDPGAQQYRLSAAMTEPVFVTKREVTHKGRKAILLSFSKIMIPKQPGRIDIRPASVSADVEVDRKRSFFGSQPVYKRFMVASEPLTLTVLALPEQDKPVDFYGLVGRYSISASAKPTTVNVGDPITLTVTISGDYLKAVRWPRLEHVPELAKNFKIPSQVSSPAVRQGVKIFTQTIRANNDKVTRIPPIPLVFFDADKGCYIVEKSEPIDLTVAPTKILTGQDLQGREITRAAREIEAIKKGLAANYEGFDALKNQSFTPARAVISPHFALIWTPPLILLLAGLVIRFSTRSDPDRAAARRRRSALKRATRELNTVASANAHNKAEMLASAMKQYVGDRFDKVTGSLTAADCRRVIEQNTALAGSAHRFEEIVAHCEAARYASVETAVDNERIKSAIELLREIENKTRR